jgi:ATP-binding cassette, subfamily B, multidrug efflux pump
LRPHWRAMLFGTLALFVVNAVGVYIPLLIRDSVDSLRQAFSFDRVLHYVWIILLLATLMWFIRMASRVIIFGIGRQIEYELKQRIFQHLLHLEPDYFSDNTSGDLMNRATSDVENIRRLVGFAILSLINTVFAYGLRLPAMLSISVILTVEAIAVYPLMLIAVQLFSRRLQEQQRSVQENLSDLSALIQEDMSGMALIKIYAQEENERRAFKENNQRLLKANLALVQTRNFLFPVVEALAYVSFLILLAFGTQEIARGAITVGDFVALLILVEQLVFPTALLGFTITAYQRGEVSIDRLEAIFLAQPKIRDSSESLALPSDRVRGTIEARHLGYTYPGATQPALKDLNFIIKPGETVAVVGPVGCGKSTLANAIPRLLDIKPGQLFLDDRDITQIQLSDLRGAIACVPQDSFLFSATIRDNIRYGDPLKEQSAIEKATQIAQIHSEILNFPLQYDTLVGERGITLSGGQRQRAALARALLVDAPVLILDDALSSVDNQTATQILHNLSVTQGKTVIFISHQLSAAAQTDRILVMDKGEIVQIGTHTELVEKPGLYQSLWQKHQLKAVLSNEPS